MAENYREGSVALRLSPTRENIYSAKIQGPVGTLLSRTSRAPDFPMYLQDFKYNFSLTKMVALSEWGLARICLDL